MKTSHSDEYALRLARIESAWWRRWIDVQAPYRLNLRRLKLGFTLDVGAGIGRNLLHLGGNGIGVDPNVEGVKTMKARGLRAFVPEDFNKSAFAKPASFDSLLFSHVLEHLSAAAAQELIDAYLPYLKIGGRAIIITPQKSGYNNDPTHVNFVDDGTSAYWLEKRGLIIEKRYSFPFPRLAGYFFPHNEFVVVGRK